MAAAHGTLLFVTVMPNARRSEATGLVDGALRVRLAAPPVEGRANEALIEWLADQLGLARRAIELRRGASSRRKQVLLACDVAQVQDWLVALVPDAGGAQRDAAS